MAHHKSKEVAHLDDSRRLGGLGLVAGCISELAKLSTLVLNDNLGRRLRPEFIIGVGVSKFEVKIIIVIGGLSHHGVRQRRVVNYFGVIGGGGAVYHRYNRRGGQ